MLSNVYFIVAKNEFSISYAQGCLNLVFADDVKRRRMMTKKTVIKMFSNTPAVSVS